MSQSLEAAGKKANSISVQVRKEIVNLCFDKSLDSYLMYKKKSIFFLLCNNKWI